MLLAAIGFVCYALNHPEGSLPASIEVTWFGYISYLVVMVVLFVAPGGKREKRN